MAYTEQLHLVNKAQMTVVKTNQLQLDSTKKWLELLLDSNYLEDIALRSIVTRLHEEVSIKCLKRDGFLQTTI